MNLAEQTVGMIKNSFAAVSSSEFYEEQIKAHQKLLDRLFAERLKKDPAASREDFYEHLQKNASEQLFGAAITLDCVQRAAKDSGLCVQ